MTVERAGNHFVISRRVGRQRLYFQFHVNGSKGSWLLTKDHATRYRRIAYRRACNRETDTYRATGACLTGRVLTSCRYPVNIPYRMIPRIDPDVRYIGSSKLRELTAIELRALTGAIVVQGANNTPLVVILPYETYLRVQDAARGPRQKGDKER